MFVVGIIRETDARVTAYKLSNNALAIRTGREDRLKGTYMKKATKILAGVALALVLAAVPLAACSSTSSDSGDSSSAEQTAAVDTSSWKTLADAIAASTERPSYGWDDNYFIGEFHVNDNVIRVVAKSDAETLEKSNALDFSDEDYDAKFDEIVSGLEIVSAEDITAQRLSEADMAALVGKTGKELIDDGFKFEYYDMYGTEGGCSASMAKGYFAYSVSFDATVAEDETEDGGEAIMDAKVTDVQCVGTSNDALDPSLVD